jgi:hypothetical protein
MASRNSFVAFNANFAGNPPMPFRPFAAGERCFYLVGVTQGDGQAPAPTAQLSLFVDTVKGSGRDPIDTVTEVAKAWQGRKRVTVATRSYSWERFTRGAKAVARELAQWTAPDGSPLTIWSYVVSCQDAADMGYRTPDKGIVARPGARGVGYENKANATVKGAAVVQAPKVDADALNGPDDDQLADMLASEPAPAAPAVDVAPAAPAAPALTGSALIAAMLADMGG